LSMAKRQADLDRGVERMLALSGTSNEVTFKVTRGVTRPVWEPDEGTMALYEKAHGIAKSMGLELPHGSAGGGSDGNFTGAMGIPTLDGLGVRGADAHTLNEHIEVDSLAERGRLMAGLLATLTGGRRGRTAVSLLSTSLKRQRVSNGSSLHLRAKRRTPPLRKTRHGLRRFARNDGGAACKTGLLPGLHLPR